MEARLGCYNICVLVSAWFSYRHAFADGIPPVFDSSHPIHLGGVLICSFNAALRSAQDGMRRSEINFRSLVTNAPYGICRIVSMNCARYQPRIWLHAAYGSNRVAGRNMGTLYSDPRQWSQLSTHLLSVR